MNQATVGSVNHTAPLAFTIVTRNHFHLAAGLAQNFHQSNPNGRLLIVVADADDPQTGQATWEWLHPAHAAWRDASSVDGLGRCSLRSARELIGDSLWPLAFQYSSLELTCCLKSLVAQCLLAAGESQFLYLDADTRLYVSVADCLADISTQGGILLTPHIQQPFPHDECYPNNVDLLRSGVFNAGVIGFSITRESRQKVGDFLQWWTDCCQHHCIVDPRSGLFVDQRWLDQAPAMFPAVFLSRHPGLNVGYWNLHERQVANGESGYRVTSHLPSGQVDEPLQVFHFSGAARRSRDGTSMLHRLSRHQNRHSIKQLPEVAELLETYLNSWTENHWEYYKSIEYAFDRFADGDSIDPRWREAYRQNSQQVRDNGPNPFVVYNTPLGKSQLQYAAGTLKAGRFQFQLDEMQRKIESLRQRLDRLPWRRLAHAAKQWQKQWFKKAG